MPIQTVPPKYSPELLAATEKTLKAHDLRCKPGIGLGEVLDTLVVNKVEVAESFGTLALSMDGAPVHSQKTIEGLARERKELFYPRETAGIKSRSELDTAGKMQFIREQGLSAWEKLPATFTESDVVVLDQTKLNRKQWLSLPIKQRVELSGIWGAKVVAQIIGRT